MKKVDIVIPIYNAYDFTKKCIETIIENTNLKEHNLVLINDKSPDEKIMPLLNDVKEKNKNLNIIVLENEENYGFVKTVNRGMSYSNNDVILLNSDTEVTKNWIEKLSEVAYSKENVASVTPLSNNATLASIPNFLEENNLPSFISLEEYAEEIEKCSFNDFPEISTAHGFCMYIRRNAINEVGLFDDDTFEKGYGEENDFSYRCVKKGFVHLMCDNTFIYHKGTQSFTEKKLELVNSHLKILEEKYPTNFAQTNLIVNTNPFKYIQDNIKYYINNKHRKNILIFVHDFVSRDNKLVGGTALHIYDLIDNLREDLNIHVCYYSNDGYKLKSFFEDSISEVFLGKINSFENINLFNNDYKKIIEKVFSIVDVDLVHVHHLKNHYFDLFDVMEEKEIPFIMTLHDFYMVCPTIVLLEKNEKCCVDNKECNCRECLKELIDVDGNIIEKWRNNVYNALRRAQLLVAPSNSTKEIFNKYYKDLKIQVVEHGVDYEELKKDKVKHDKKNIAFIGGINKQKGVDILKEFVNKANSDELKFNVHMFGTTSESSLNKSSKNYTYHGLYNREDIAKLLEENDIDLVCMLSIWHETYSYTLTEAITAKVPVIALDYGAVSERVQKDNLGWIIEKDSSIEQIINKINEIFENSKQYDEVLKSINYYLNNLKSVSENANEYKEIYNKLIYNKSNFESLNKDLLKEILKRVTEKNITVDNSDLINQLNIERASHNQRIVEYDTTVKLLREEIDRLNKRIGDVMKDEEKYNKILSSKRIKLLEKIKFIKL